MASGTGWGMALFGAGVVMGAMGTRSVDMAGLAGRQPVPFSAAVGTAARMSGSGEVTSLDPLTVAATLLLGLVVAAMLAMIRITSRRPPVGRASHRGTLLGGDPPRQ